MPPHPGINSPFTRPGIHLKPVAQSPDSLHGPSHLPHGIPGLHLLSNDITGVISFELTGISFLLKQYAFPV